jgi:MurNAc alpha-1-phosphate uridylyltransferase
MVLAAGRGTRMGALTATLPKPLLELAGESLIERHVRRLAAAGIAEVVVNVSYEAAQFEAALGDGSRWGVRLRYSREGEQPLETAGGIVHALEWLTPGPFLLVNADVYTDFDFATLAPGAGSGLVVLVPNPPHHRRGDFGLGADARVTAAGPKLTFAGISVLESGLFAGLAPGARPLKPILDAAIAAGALYGRRYDGTWIDVGTPERLAEARAAAAAPEP